MKIKEKWVSWEEFDLLLPSLSPTAAIDFLRIGGLTPGSIPFADAAGMFTEDNGNLFWDETNVRLGIGVGAPLVREHIRGLACPAYAGLHPDTILLLENDDNVTVQIQCATTGEGRIRFCDDDFNPSAGTIQYIFSDDELQFGVATALQMRLTSIGLGVGWVTPTNQLHVYGAGTTGGAGGFFDGVMARFQCSSVKHVGIAIDAPPNRDPYVVFSENGAAMWDIRNDASEGDEFNIRYQAGGANDIVFIITPTGDVEIPLGYLALMNSEELRFYDNGNYVGFEAPALSADQIWILPTADGGAGEFLQTDGAGNLSWAAAGGVTTFLALTDTPAGYAGEAGKVVVVNAVPDALEFVDTLTLAGVTVGNEGLHILDTGGDHDLIIKPGEDLTVDRILTIIVGDAARTFTLSGDNKVAMWEATTSINLRSNAELRFYDNGNYVGFEAPALSADQIWILPTADGGAGEFLQTDGAGNLSWAAGGAGAATFLALTDTPASYAGEAGKFVKVNATPDALIFADLALGDLPAHASAHHSGGGDQVNHDSLVGFVAAEHKSLPNTIAEVLSNHTKAVHDALGINAGTVDGFSASQTRNSPNTCAVRDANGYLQLGWINTTSGDCGTSAPIRIYGSHSGNYIRYYTPANFATVMKPYFDDHFLLLAGGTLTGYVYARDHGAAATDMIVNVCYGTGNPPTANTTTIGTLFVKYTA